MELPANRRARLDSYRRARMLRADGPAWVNCLPIPCKRLRANPDGCPRMMRSPLSLIPPLTIVSSLRSRGHEGQSLCELPTVVFLSAIKTGLEFLVRAVYGRTVPGRASICLVPLHPVSQGRRTAAIDYRGRDDIRPSQSQ